MVEKVVGRLICPIVDEFEILHVGVVGDEELGVNAWSPAWGSAPLVESRGELVEVVQLFNRLAVCCYFAGIADHAADDF